MKMFAVEVDKAKIDEISKLLPTQKWVSEDGDVEYRVELDPDNDNIFELNSILPGFWPEIMESTYLILIQKGGE